MNLGDIIYLSDETDKKYIVLATKETNEKEYALITEFNAKINIKEKNIKNADINLKKSILISKNKKTEKIEFESDKNIIYELCSKIFY